MTLITYLLRLCSYFSSDIYYALLVSQIVNQQKLKFQTPSTASVPISFLCLMSNEARATQTTITKLLTPPQIF